MPKTSIGRHPDQDLQLLDRMISKTHALITVNKNGSYTITDVGSRNGTLVNGEILKGSLILNDGDEIGLGTHILRFIHADEDIHPTQALLLDDAQIDLDISKDTRISQQDLDAKPADSSSKSIRQRMRDFQFLPETQVLSEADIRRDYEKLRIAAELAVEADKVFDLDDLLAIILDKAFQVFCADRGAILLRDENGEMKTRLAIDRHKRVMLHYKISETLLEEVVLDKSAVLSRDALQDQRFSSSHSIVVDNVRSTMCVPLLYEDEVLGVINLDTQLVTSAFVEKDLQILTSFARQAAQNIQRGRAIEALERNAVVRENIKRIIPPHLIEDVLSGKIQLEKSGTKITATVLFVDIRGFTQMTEQNAAENIVSMLNDYFETMVECIFRNEGALDKFVGDEVMAVWGVNVAKDDHAKHAVDCAIDMMTAVVELNQRRLNTALPPISIGIGIASGTMIAGYMGSTQAMSHTVIGDTVNLGARLCSAAQPGEILINDGTRTKLDDKLNAIPLPPIMVKGKQAPINIFRIIVPSKFENDINHSSFHER